jgi:hypothetical protein
MTHETVAADSASTTGRAESTAELIELGKLRSERLLIEAARDYYYHRWLADEELIGRLRLRVKHLEESLTRIGAKCCER